MMMKVFFRSVATENEPLAGLVLLFILLGSFTVGRLQLRGLRWAEPNRAPGSGELESTSKQ